MRSLKLSLLCLAFLYLQGFQVAAQKPELYVQSGHSSPLTQIAFSPDGKILATASYSAVKLWDAASQQELMAIQSPAQYSGCLAFHPNGKILATGGSDHHIRFWDLDSGREVGTFTGHTNVIKSVAFNSDGRLMATASVDNTVKLWDVVARKELRSFIFNAPVLSWAAISPDGKMIASSGSELNGRGVFKLWDASTGNELHFLEGFTVSQMDNSRMAFANGGKTLVASGSNGIRFWDVASGRILKDLHPRYAVYWFAFSPDEKTFAAGNSGYTWVWDTTSWVERGTFRLQSCGGCAAFSSGTFSPDGKVLAVNDNNAVQVRDVATGLESKVFKGRATEIQSLAFSPDGKMIATANGYGPLKLWDVGSGYTLRIFKTTETARHFSKVIFSPDSTTLAAASTGNDILSVWQVNAGDKPMELPGLEPGFMSLESIAFSPDGKTVAGGFVSGAIKFWERSSGKLLYTFNPQQYSSAIAFSPDGQTLASGDRKEIHLLDAFSGRILRTLSGRAERGPIVFTPDGKTLIAGGPENTIKLWDVSSGREIGTLMGHSSSIDQLAVSPNGKLAASVDWHRSLRLWDLASQRELKLLQGRTDDATAVAFSPDSRMLASGNADATVRLWDLSSGKHLASLIAFDDLQWVAATPDGLFDGTPGGWRQINWRFSRRLYDLAPVEIFFDDFYYPGLLPEIFAGGYPSAPADLSKKDRRQPALEIAGPDGGIPQADRNVTVAIKVSSALAGAKDVRLFRNGLLVKLWRGDVLQGNSTTTLQATLPIVAGENRLTAYAFNRDNIKSGDAEVTIVGSDNLKRKGVAYVLAIGVNSYANGQYDLKYAVADARDFADEFKKQQASIGRYESVEVVSLTDDGATKSRILEALTGLAAKMQPEDALVIFFAGHGTAQRNRFYLVPHDLGYNGPRTRLNRIGLNNLLSHSISDREIENALETIDASQIVLVIDACNSGQALEAEEKRRGPMNSKGLAQLAYEKGMYILTAAQSYQAAKEASRLGHGYLTYALVEEGLKTHHADREPKDGEVLLREWLDYATQRVPEIQQEEIEEKRRQAEREAQLAKAGVVASTKNQARPNASKDGRQLTHTASQSPDERRLQRPRVFYRRETDQRPLVVARP